MPKPRIGACFSDGSALGAVESLPPRESYPIVIPALNYLALKRNPRDFRIILEIFPADNGFAPHEHQASAMAVAISAAESAIACADIFFALVSRSILQCELLQIDSNCDFNSIPEPALK